MKTIKNVKRTLFVIFVLTMGTIQIKAQKKTVPHAQQVLKYDTTRTVEQLRIQLRPTTVLNGNIKKLFLEAINEDKKVNGETDFLTTADIERIFDSTEIIDEAYVVSSEFWNAARYGTSDLEWRDMQGWKSVYLAFRHNGRSIIYCKLYCGNPYKKKNPQPKKKFKPSGKKEEEKDTTCYEWVTFDTSYVIKGKLLGTNLIPDYGNSGTLSFTKEEVWSKPRQVDTTVSHWMVCADRKTKYAGSGEWVPTERIGEEENTTTTDTRRHGRISVYGSGQGLGAIANGLLNGGGSTSNNGGGAVHNNGGGAVHNNGGGSTSNNGGGAVHNNGRRR